MEYTICNETLVYYTLRDQKGNYVTNSGKAGSLKDCVMFNTLNGLKQYQEEHPEFTEVRKVKVIDIGDEV